MQIYLGVDGGGTGCRARLERADGTILAEASGGPANIASNRDGALANILTVCQQVFEAAGLPFDPQIPTAMGLAGVNISGTTDWLRPRLPFARLRIVTDAVTMTHGALQGREGIVAAIGTGSVMGVWQGGKYRQFGGWGFALGDEGSGAVLGRRLLAHAVMAQDGVVTMTPLLAEVLADFGGAEGAAAFAVHALPVDYARLAPRLVGCDDPAAQAIWAEEALPLRRLIHRLQRDGDLPIAWTGGLGPIWRQIIGADWPSLEPRGSSLEGAILMAKGEI